VVYPALRGCQCIGAVERRGNAEMRAERKNREGNVSTYPCVGSDVEVMAVFERTDCSHDIYKGPASANTTPKQPRRRSIFLHNAEECMYSNRANKDTAGEISCRHKPALGPAYWCSDHYAVVS